MCISSYAEEACGISGGQMVHARASVYFSRACLRMESACVSSDDDKYCIVRRHAIFIVTAERYGRRRKFTRST